MKRRETLPAFLAAPQDGRPVFMDMKLLFTVFTAVFVAELGDKTQLGRFKHI